jgi:tetratricopeptide (TPR) repeat protein
MLEVAVGRTRGAVLLAGLALTACAGGGTARGAPATPAPRVEALSLLGRPLFSPALTPQALERLTRDLERARTDYERNPNDADAIIWLGRRLAYLGQYRAAIEIFSEGIAKHPQDARLYRHRGHRYITTRQFNGAIADLERAAELVAGTPDEVEPDGAPNRFNIPVSTLHTNIWYHLALAHYLQHDFERALPAWQRALELSTNDDMLVAAADWLYMTLRRLGRDAEAMAVLQRVRPEMQILENDAYHRRLLMYKGLLDPESLMPAGTGDAIQIATYGYGLAIWHLVRGDTVTADRLFNRILEAGNWAPFGYIAAEAELARRRR